MQDAFDELDDVTALNKDVIGQGGKYNQLASVKTILDRFKNGLNTDTSYANYETAKERALADLPNALNTELVTLIKSIIKSPASLVSAATREINAAEKIADKINAYAKYAASVEKDSNSDLLLNTDAQLLDAAVQKLVKEQSATIKGLVGLEYDAATNTATFKVDKNEKNPGKLYGFISVKDQESQKGLIDMFDDFAQGATEASYILNDKETPRYTVDKSGLEKSQLMYTAAGLLFRMAGRTISDTNIMDSGFKQAAMELTFKDVIGTKGVATFNFVTEDGVEYSVDYTLEFVGVTVPAK